MDLSALIQEAKTHNQHAFNTLFDLLWDEVYAFVLNKTKREYLAEEISLETFAKAFDRIATYDSKYSFKTWLFTIAKNTHIDYTRRNKNTTEMTIEALEYDKSLQAFNEIPSPEEMLIKRQNLDALLMQIKTLGEEFQTILKLRYFEGMSYKEMSVKLRIPINTVKVKIFRAKKMLAQTIDHEKN